MVVQFVPVQDQLMGVILSDSGNGIPIQVVSGILGSGKTSILRHLEDSRAYAVRVHLEKFNPGHHGEQGDTASVGAVQGSFQRFKELLEELIIRVDADLDVFRDHVLEVRNSDVHNAKVDRIGHSFDECRSALDPNVLARAWRDAADSVSHKFAALWNARTEQQRCLMLLDGTLSFAAARNEGSILEFDAGTKSAGGKIDVNEVHDGPLLLSGPEPPSLILGSVSRSEGFPSLRRLRRRRHRDSPVPRQYT